MALLENQPRPRKPYPTKLTAEEEERFYEEFRTLLRSVQQLADKWGITRQTAYAIRDRVETRRKVQTARSAATDSSGLETGRRDQIDTLGGSDTVSVAQPSNDRNTQEG